jgi:phage-related minor tail protein
MSMVKGTMSMKDAFRSMATDIIGELYRIFVVKQITGFITKSIQSMFPSFASIPARANGGPVGANTPYMVGERGPELFVPARSGSITPNERLGGDGGTTVVQNFHFAANGDDSVKKLIAQAAPQIAKMTEKGIIDSRRRGGQFRSVFG